VKLIVRCLRYYPEYYQYKCCDPCYQAKKINYEISLVRLKVSDGLFKVDRKHNKKLRYILL